MELTLQRRCTGTRSIDYTRRSAQWLDVGKASALALTRRQVFGRTMAFTTITLVVSVTHAQ
jgi:hypothetical protein